MDTKKTTNEIVEALVEYYGGWRKNLCVPNVTVSSWLTDHEADLVVVNPSGYAHEFEIKRSFVEFKRDFGKHFSHGAEWIYRFSYVVPESALDKVMDCLDKSYLPKDMPQVLSYDEELRFSVHGGHAELPAYTDQQARHRYLHRKMYLEETLRLARVGTMRYWDLRTKKKEK